MIGWASRNCGSFQEGVVATGVDCGDETDLELYLGRMAMRARVMSQLSEIDAFYAAGKKLGEHIAK